MAAIFSHCCGFIDGQTNPNEILDKPDLEALKMDFDEMLDNLNEFN